MRFFQYTSVSRSVPMVLRAVSKIMRVGTDFDVLVSVEIGAVSVQTKAQFQYDRDSPSDAKLLICQYRQEHFWVPRNSSIFTDASVTQC